GTPRDRAAQRAHENEERKAGDEERDRQYKEGLLAGPSGDRGDDPAATGHRDAVGSPSFTSTYLPATGGDFAAPRVEHADEGCEGGVVLQCIRDGGVNVRSLAFLLRDIGGNLRRDSRDRGRFLMFERGLRNPYTESGEEKDDGESQ